MTRLLSADIGRIFLKGAVFAHQLYALLHGDGGDPEFDWDPDVTGLRPDLDEKERVATQQLEAIWREITRRRSVRQNQNLHNR